MFGPGDRHGGTRLWLRRGRRVLFRQYMSLASLAVLATALAITLGVTSFGDASRSDRHAVLVPLRNDAPLASIPPETATTAPRVTYYIYDDPIERSILATAIRGEARDLQRRNVLSDFGDVIFVEATAENGDEVSALLNRAQAPDSSLGYEVVVVDLR